METKADAQWRVVELKIKLGGPFFAEAVGVAPVGGKIALAKLEVSDAPRECDTTVGENRGSLRCLRSHLWAVGVNE